MNTERDYCFATFKVVKYKLLESFVFSGKLYLQGEDMYIGFPDDTTIRLYEYYKNRIIVFDSLKNQVVLLKINEEEDKHTSMFMGKVKKV